MIGDAEHMRQYKRGRDRFISSRDKTLHNTQEVGEKKVAHAKLFEKTRACEREAADRRSSLAV